MLVFLVFPCLITLGGVVIMLMGRQLLLMTGLEWCNSLGIVQAHVSRTVRLFN